MRNKTKKSFWVKWRDGTCVCIHIPDVKGMCNCTYKQATACDRRLVFLFYFCKLTHQKEKNIHSGNMTSHHQHFIHKYIDGMLTSEIPRYWMTNWLVWGEGGASYNESFPGRRKRVTRSNWEIGKMKRVDFKSSFRSRRKGEEVSVCVCTVQLHTWWTALSIHPPCTKNSFLCTKNHP